MGYKLDILKMLPKRANPAFKKEIITTKIEQRKIKYAHMDKQTPNYHSDDL